MQNFPGIPQPGSRVLRYLNIAVVAALVLYLAKAVMIPLFFGLLIAMVMYPICAWLESRRVPRPVAILICLVIVTVIFLALVLLLGWQLSLFREDVPRIAAKLRPTIPRMQQWLRDRLSISLDMQESWIRQTVLNISGNAGSFLQTTLTATANAFFALFLIPIHTALFLYHRQTFVRFLQRVVGKHYNTETNLVLHEVIHTYFSYIKGMMLVYLIVGVLNSVGLLALGVPHAILFGMLTAIMTIIPYVGIVVSASLPIAVAYLTTDSLWYPAGVVLVFSFVQYLEANVIFPKVVGKELNVNTWAMLMAILIGGAIWGVAGMVLFIPFVAILKIASDHVKALEPINILLNRNGSQPTP